MNIKNIERLRIRDKIVPDSFIDSSSMKVTFESDLLPEYLENKVP